MDGGAFAGSEAGEPVEEAAHHRRRATVTQMLFFSLHGVSQERHVGEILFVADSVEETFIKLKRKAVAVANGEDNSVGGDRLTLLGDGEFQQSRLAGGVNYLHDLLSPISRVVRSALGTNGNPMRP